MSLGFLDLILFADDTNIIFSHNNVDFLERSLNTNSLVPDQ